MDNKKTHLVLLITAVLCLFSCSEWNRSNKSNFKPIVSYENEMLNVASLDSEEHAIVISINNKVVMRKNYKNMCKLTMPNILNGYESTYDIALIATYGDQTGIALSVKVDNVIDTIVYAAIEPSDIREHYPQIRGNCAKLIPAESDPKLEVKIKKWLFQRNTKLDPYQIQQMRGIISKISSNGTNDYVTNDPIPVIKNLIGLDYSVKSDMQADHYVLYAASSDEDIKEFVKETVANNYELTTKSLTDNMKCFRKMDSDGYKCIALIGINDDWSYKIEPLGLVAIDNTPPTPSDNYSHNINQIRFKKNQRVILPKTKPLIDGTANVSVVDWDGNGVECNVTFEIAFSGDIKSITIVRNKKLSYPGVHKIENKVISLASKQSPYIFTYELHFEGGNNIIPIIVEDYHGNKKDYSITVHAEFTYNKPDIQIDNNINVW